jgi:hypothetical protein
MPDSTGKLTPEEHLRIINWINTRWQRGVPCEMCGMRNIWNAGDRIVTPVNLADGHNFVLGGVHYPQIPILCSNCGNTKYVNAIVAGIIIPHMGD